MGVILASNCVPEPADTANPPAIFRPVNEEVDDSQEKEEEEEDDDKRKVREMEYWREEQGSSLLVHVFIEKRSTNNAWVTS